MSLPAAYKRADLRSISGIFSRRALNSIVGADNGQLFKNILNDAGVDTDLLESQTVLDVYIEAYNILKDYSVRSEYIYKNLLVRKVFLSRHSLRKSILLQEMRINGRIADAVILNGKAHAFEIKSERDSLSRVVDQISSYRTVFAHTSVIAAHKYIDRLHDLVPKSTGLSVVTKSYEISSRREAVSDYSDIDPSAIANLLRRQEKIRVLEGVGESVPDMPNTQIDQYLTAVIEQFPLDYLYPAMIKTLRNGRSQDFFEDTLKSLPACLHSLVLEKFRNPRQMKKFVLAAEQKVNTLG